MFYYLGLLICTAIFLYYFFGKNSNNDERKNKSPPLVKGCWPIVGHGLSFSKDIIGFIKQSYQTYGKVFRLKIFRKDIIVVCDHELKDQFFKATEKNMSLYEVLNSLYFGNAFSENEDNLPRIIGVVKKTIKVRFDDFSNKIMEEASRMITRMKKKSNVDLTTEMIRFVSNTSARCFIGIELSDEFYDVLMEFTHFLNKIVIMTYFFPRWLLKLTVGRKLRVYRQKITNLLNYTINKYHDDPKLDDSPVLRGAVDYFDKDLNRKLTNTEISEIIICLLYVSSENTALGLSSTIIDLADNPKYWNMVMNESKPYLLNGDVKSLFNSPIIDACVMESARLNSHVFALERKPISKDTYLGDYYVGDAECIAICEPMMMVHDCAKFDKATTYNPDRFIKQNAEAKTPQDVMTWGAGVHLCPGRDFAKYEIKAAIALITNNFKIFKFSKKGNLNFFSPSAFAEREVIVNMEPLNTAVFFNTEAKSCQIIPLKDGWLIKNCLNRDEQINFYRKTVELSNNSSEHKEILNADRKKAYPLTYYNLVHTHSSNCSEPKEFFDLAQDIWLKLSETNNLPTKKFNSFYAQLFAQESIMKTHRDEFVDWGISISLGASCEFLYDDKVIILHSGDVVVADFSKVNHGVLKILEDTLPGWYDEIENFGRQRCSIQIRDINHCTNQPISIDEFKKYLTSI